MRNILKDKNLRDEYYFGARVEGGNLWDTPKWGDREQRGVPNVTSAPRYYVVRYNKGTRYTSICQVRKKEKETERGKNEMNHVILQFEKIMQ